MIILRNMCNFTNTRRIGMVLAMLLSLAEGYAQTITTYTYPFENGVHNIEFVSETENNFYVFEDGFRKGPFSELGSVSISGGTHTFNVNTTGTITVSGRITLNGGNLIIQLGDNMDNNTAVFKRGRSSDKAMILVKGENANLSIKGKSKEKMFYIHGNGDFYIPSGNLNDGYDKAKLTGDQNGQVSSKAAILKITDGEVYLEHVWLANNCNEEEHGGAVNFNVTNYGKLEMHHCLIDKCYSINSGGAMFYTSKKTSSIILNDVETRNCFSYSGDKDSSYGGTFRTGGNSYCKITFTDCKIHDNISNFSSGGIAFNSGVIDPIQIINCEIYNNKGDKGGAITLSGGAVIQKCSIHDNEARSYGGGIDYSTYNSTNDIPNYAPFNGSLELDAETKIYNNKAEYGGGVSYRIRPMRINTGESGSEWIVYKNNEGNDLEMSFTVDGTKIYDNEANENGGGFYFSKMEDTPESYITHLNLYYGNIYSNEANENGGGFYVDGTIPIQIGIAGKMMSFYDNEAAMSGGAFYINNGNITITECKLGEFGKANIAKNGNGGAVYIDKGSVTINGGTISYNKALKQSGSEGNGNGGAFYANEGDVIIYGGTILSNEAKSDGGAMYVKGNVTVSGSTISGNVAAENGGAFSINEGNITVSGGIIGNQNSFNRAKNGGAIYLQGGDATITGGSINYNEASRNGGGLYVDGGNVNLNSGNVSSNRAKGENDGVGGGGIYSKGGVVTIADGVRIEKNVSKEYGGAIYIDNGGIINVNSSEFAGNFANVAGTAIIQNGVMYVKGTPVFEKNQTVHLPKIKEAPMTRAESDANYQYRVITKAGTLGEKTFIPVTMDADDESLGRDVLVSSKGSSNSTSGMVVSEDFPKFDIRPSSKLLCAVYNENGLDADTYTPKNVIELAGLSQVRIIRKGLNIGESAIYTVKDITDKSSVQTLFTVSVTGKGNEGSDVPLVQVERIISGIQPLAGQNRIIKVEETPWSWSYTNTSTSVDPSSGSEVSKDKSWASGSLGQLQTLTFTFDGSKTSENIAKHGESQAVNLFGEYESIIVTVDVKDWTDGGREHISF